VIRFPSDAAKACLIRQFQLPGFIFKVLGQLEKLRLDGRIGGQLRSLAALFSFGSGGGRIRRSRMIDL
jgi:hypothetical protein